MKSICVPKNVEARIRLDYNEHTKGDVFELEFDDSTLYKLWKLEFFYNINQIAGTIIDDFEDQEIVEEEKLKNVLLSTVFEPTQYDFYLQSVVKQIQVLFEEALNRNTGVFFYF